MLTDEQRDKKLAMIRKQLEFLTPSFDAVHIFATKHDAETGDTSHFSIGVGNFFARYGHIKSWVNAEEIEQRKDNA